MGETNNTPQAQAFINRWQGVSASELATAQSFVMDLCTLLGVDKPHPTAEQDYMFERPITFRHGDGSSSPGRIDCYKRGHFVLEAKKLKAGAHTKGFDDGLLRARAEVRQIWLEPDSLNPARISAQVTREVAQVLAQLAKSLEAGTPVAAQSYS